MKFSFVSFLLYSFQRAGVSYWDVFLIGYQDGGDEENRTPDPLLARQMLSQLSYTPIVGSMLWRFWFFGMLSFFDGFLFFFVFSLSVWCDLWVRENVVGLTRLELVTSRLSGVRSNQLSYRPIHLRVWFSQNWAVLRMFSSSDVRPTYLWNFFQVCLLRKEVIQPHLPIRLPCYDFTPVIDPAFGSSFLAVGSLTSGVTDSHGVTGGVYKTRERIHRSILICDY